MATNFNNCSPISMSPPTALKSISFIKTSGLTWIYCNFPEVLPQSALGDYNIVGANKYLNQVLVSGEAEVFTSYRNMTGRTIYFGVQLYNPGSSSINITVKNRAFNVNAGSPSQGWNWVACQTWVDFLNYTSTNTVTVGPGQSVWIYADKGPIYDQIFFNSFVRFNCNGQLWCFPYVYTSRSNINGTATLYPWSTSSQYRGRGDTYIISSSNAINVSSMPFSYRTGECSLNQSNEMITIVDPENNASRSCSNNANLGNWGVHYMFNTTIRNDTSSAKRIKGFVGTTTPLENAIIKYGSSLKYCSLAQNQYWNWLTEDSLAPGASKLYSYEFIHAAQSYSPTTHIWSAENI